VALVRERTIPTERPPPVGEVSAIIIIIIIINEAVGLQVSALLPKFDSTVIRVQIVVDRVILGQF
jgi:hypothetical protein